MAALWTEACRTSPTQDALREGYEVYRSRAQGRRGGRDADAHAGTLTLRGVRTSGQVLLGRDAVRAGHVQVEG
jgi:hypothetical protein